LIIFSTTAVTLGVVQLDALVHFLALDLGKDQADGGQASGFLGAHGGFHVVGDLIFKAHGYSIRKGKRQNPLRQQPERASHIQIWQPGLALAVTGSAAELY
jgi:hypothetical protein